MLDLYEKGMVTGREITWWFLGLLEEAANDESAIQLCENLPSWLCKNLIDYIEKLRGADYCLMWVSSNETRSLEQAEADAKARGELIKRLEPLILEMIS